MRRRWPTSVLVVCACASGPLAARPAAAEEEPSRWPAGFEACEPLSAKVTRLRATAAVVTQSSACLDALASSRPAAEKLGPEYYDVVPLVETRVLQAMLYGGLGESAAVATLARRLVEVRARIDPAAARSADARRRMDTAVQNYGLSRRSGRTAARPWHRPRVGDPGCRDGRCLEECPGQTAAANASASLHVHLHLTYHGGTEMLKTHHTMTCSLLQPTCAAWPPSRAHLFKLASGRGRKAARAAAQLEAAPPEAQRAALERGFLALHANARYEETARQWGNVTRGRDGVLEPQHCPSAQPPSPFLGSDPVDATFMEPILFRGAPVDSARIVWTSTARHPTAFALERGVYDSFNFNPDFMLQKWMDRGGGGQGGFYCTSEAILQAMNAHKSSLDDPPWLKSCYELRRRNFDRLVATSFKRADLDAAKDLARHFSILMLIEHYSEGLLAYCRRLRWPRETCRTAHDWTPRIAAGKDQSAIVEASRAHSAPAKRARRRRLSPHPHHGLAGLVDLFKWGRDQVADVLDLAQLSQELYFFARELNRAQHLELGLEPPGTGLLPPGEEALLRRFFPEYSPKE